MRGRWRARVGVAGRAHLPVALAGDAAGHDQRPGGCHGQPASEGVFVVKRRQGAARRPEVAVEVAGGVVAGQRELLVPSAGVEGQAADHGGSATRGHHGVGERVALRSKSHHLAAITEGLIHLSLVRVPGKSERGVRRLLREKVASDEQPAIGCPGDGVALRAGIGERRGGAAVVAKPRCPRLPSPRR